MPALPSVLGLPGRRVADACIVELVSMNFLVLLLERRDGGCGLNVDRDDDFPADVV